MYKIYKHTNIENGLVYIGYTGNSPETRWKGGRGYKTCPRFFSAILEYGCKHFLHEIIEDNIITKEKALEREQYWIKYYQSDNPKYGYNISLKKEKRNKIGYFYTEETKQKHKEGSRKGGFRGGKNGTIKVQCIETQEIFNSLTDAAKWCNLKDTSTISSYLHGKGMSAGKHPITHEKLHWKYI